MDLDVYYDRESSYPYLFPRYVHAHMSSPDVLTPRPHSMRHLTYPQTE